MNTEKITTFCFIFLSEPVTFRPQRMLEFHDRGYEDQFSSNLTIFKQDSTFTDVKIIISGERTFYLHKVILAARSQFFNGVFTSAAHSEVQLKGITERVFQVLVHFMYTGNLRIDSSLIEDVYEGARQLQLHSLVKWLKGVKHKMAIESHVKLADSNANRKRPGSDKWTEYIFKAPTSSTDTLVAGEMQPGSDSGVMYILGGCRNFDITVKANNAQDMLDTVQAVDLQTKKAKLITPKLPHPIMLGVAVTVKDSIFYIGGCSRIHRSQVHDQRQVEISLWKYDCRLTYWTEKCPMVCGVYLPAVAVLGDNIMVMGGRDSTKRPVAFIQSYNISSDEWKLEGDLPYPVSGAAACVIDDTCYLSGGTVPRTTGHCTSTNHILKLKLTQWANAGGLIQARSNHGMCAGSGLAYVLGGGDDKGKSLTSLESYDPLTRQCTLLSPIPWARVGSSIVYLNKCIVTPGGRGPNDKNPDHQVSNDSILVYNIVRQEWNVHRSRLIVPVEYACCVLLKKNLQPQIPA